MRSIPLLFGVFVLTQMPIIYRPPANAGGGGVPGGANTQVQVNANGVFTGNPSFLFTGQDLLLYEALRGLPTDGDYGNDLWVYGGADGFYSTPPNIRLNAASFYGPNGVELYGGVGADINAGGGPIELHAGDGQGTGSDGYIELRAGDSGPQFTLHPDTDSPASAFEFYNGIDEYFTFTMTVPNTVNVLSTSGISKWDFGTMAIEGKFNSSDGTTGKTVTTCAQFKDGLCIAGS